MNSKKDLEFYKEAEKIFVKHSKNNGDYSFEELFKFQNDLISLLDNSSKEIGVIGNETFFKTLKLSIFECFNDYKKENSYRLSIMSSGSLLTSFEPYNEFL